MGNLIGHFSLLDFDTFIACSPVEFNALRSCFKGTDVNTFGNNSSLKQIHFKVIFPISLLRINTVENYSQIKKMNNLISNYSK